MIHSTNRTKGYTLIELMVVVGIISLLLGLSLNGLYNLIQWSKLNRAAAILSSELKDTQSRAFYEGVWYKICLLYTSDAADEEDSVDLGGRRIIKKKKEKKNERSKHEL